MSKSGQELKKLLRRAAGEESDTDDKNTTVMITIILRTCFFFAFAQTTYWNRIHLCSCFMQQEDEPPSSECAPKQLVEPKNEPVDSNPSKLTPSAQAQNPTPPSKSTQKRRSGGGDANTSNGAASKKIKTEPVCNFSLFAHVKFKFQPSVIHHARFFALKFAYCLYRKSERHVSRTKLLRCQFQKHLFQQERQNYHQLQRRKSGQCFVQLHLSHHKIWCRGSDLVLLLKR